MVGARMVGEGAGAGRRRGSIRTVVVRRGGAVVVGAMLAATIVLAPQDAARAGGLAACGGISTEFEGGLGTDIDPYLVASAAELRVALSSSSGCHFLQTEHIDLQSLAGVGSNPDPYLWAPVGFSGVYDGGGNEIRGLRIEMDGPADAGLIDYAYASELRDVHIVDAYLRVTTASGNEIGMVFGEHYDDTALIDSTVTGTIEVEGPAEAVGGVSGYVGAGLRPRIVGVVADVTVVAPDADKVGGLIGVLDGCDDSGSDVCEVLVADSIALGDVTGNEYVGGLIGLIDSASGVTRRVERSSAHGDVRGCADVGGLVGEAYDVRLEFVSAHGDVGPAPTCTANAGSLGGLLGVLRSQAEVMDAYARGDVTGGSSSGGDVGGLIGYLRNDAAAAVERTHSTGAVTGTPPVGGLVGYNEDADEENVVLSFWDTETSGRETSAGGTGLPTEDMTTLGTFVGEGWSIEAGWVPPTVEDASVSAALAPTSTRPDWGICPATNGGYPFLQWEYDEDPCTTRKGGRSTAPVPTAVPSGVSPSSTTPWSSASLLLVAVALLVARRRLVAGARFPGIGSAAH